METFGLIMFYSTLVLAGLSALAAAFVFLGTWLADATVEPDVAPH